MTLFEYECEVEELLDNAVNDLSPQDCIKLFESISLMLENYDYDAQDKGVIYEE